MTGLPTGPNADDAARAAADALAYRHLLDRLRTAVERRVGTSVANPDADADLPPTAPAWGRLVETRPDDVAGAVGGESSETAGGDAGGPPVEAVEAAMETGDASFLRERYESTVDAETRRELGEFYTPCGVVELAVEALDRPAAAWRAESFLDPGCGAGAFLAVCVDRKRRALREAGVPPAETLDRITATVAGVDVNPVAVRAAKATYLLSLAPLLRDADVDEVTLPVYCADALDAWDGDVTRAGGESTSDDGAARGDGDGAREFDPATVAPVDNLVGNPPWTTWGDLSTAARDRWRERSAELDLLPHRGPEARLGHANDDVGVAFAWVCVARYLGDGGRASFVLKRDLTKGPAGRTLRRLRAGERSLALRRVHDFGRLRPFRNVDAGAAVYAFDADADASFPVPTTVWTRRDGATPDFSTLAAMRDRLAGEETAFVPVDPDDGASAWVRRDAERCALGETVHDVRHGVKDDAKAVFSLDRDGLDAVDADLVYPYLRSRHVVKYGLFGYDLHLVPLRKANEDNEAQLGAEYPRTYDYLRDHRDRLDARSSSWLREGGTFYDVFGLGPYTWADYKVVWCRLGFKPHFAVVSTVDDPDLGEKTVVPGDHCMFVATDDEREAHFLCALLNSAPYQRTLRDVAGDGKASLSKSTVSRLSLPEYPGTEAADRLADLSTTAHDVVPKYTDRSKRAYNALSIAELDAVQTEIDETAERLLADRREP